MLPLEFHRQIRERLERLEDVEFPRHEADRIVEHLLGVGIGRFLARGDFYPPAGWEEEASRILDGRAAGVPLPYLLGYVYFLGYRIIVRPGVLIPRQETEGLASIAADILRHLSGNPRVLDFGTGSGCIAVYLALSYPNAVIFATDASTEAISVARENIALHNLTERVTLMLHDGLSGIDCGEIELIVSNPPYVREGDPELDPGVRENEPAEALIAPDGGFFYFKHIAEFGPRLLSPHGIIAVEVGLGQAGEVLRIFKSSGALTVETKKDLAGIDRYIIARYS